MSRIRTGCGNAASSLNSSNATFGSKRSMESSHHGADFRMCGRAERKIEHSHSTANSIQGQVMRWVGSGLGKELVALDLRGHSRAALVWLHSQDDPRAANVDIRGK